MNCRGYCCAAAVWLLFSSLSFCQEEKTIERLCDQAVNARSKPSRNSALRELWEIAKDPDNERMVLADYPLVRKTAVFALSDDSHNNQHLGILLLGIVGSKDEIPVLVRMFRKTGLEVAAVASAAKIGDDSAVAPISAFAVSYIKTNSEMVAVGIDALALIRSNAAIAALKRLRPKVQLGLRELIDQHLDRIERGE